MQYTLLLFKFTQTCIELLQGHMGPPTKHKYCYNTVSVVCVVLQLVFGQSVPLSNFLYTGQENGALIAPFSPNVIVLPACLGLRMFA